MNIFNKVFYDHQIQILNYIEKSKQFINSTSHKKATYIKNCHATHQYHGMINDRSYNSRYNLINKLNSTNYIEQNKNGFYTLTDQLTSTYHLSKDLECFFNNRSSSYADIKSLIYNSNKYAVENNILWLSDNNCFSFRNIDKVKISFKKPHQIQYINIFTNGSKIDTKNLLSDGSMTIEIIEPISMIIDSDYIIPKNLELSQDIRRLSLYIDNIQITSSDNSDYIEYPLMDVL